MLQTTHIRTHTHTHAIYNANMHLVADTFDTMSDSVDTMSDSVDTMSDSVATVAKHQASSTIDAAKAALAQAGLPELDMNSLPRGLFLFHGFNKAAKKSGFRETVVSIAAGGCGVYTYDVPENTAPYAVQFSGAEDRHHLIALVLDVSPSSDPRVKHVDGCDHIFKKPIYVVETDVPIAPVGFVVVPVS